jgi:hypothetical protein
MFNEQLLFCSSELFVDRRVVVSSESQLQLTARDIWALAALHSGVVSHPESGQPQSPNHLSGAGSSASPHSPGPNPNQKQLGFVVDSVAHRAMVWDGIVQATCLSSMLIGPSKTAHRWLGLGMRLVRRNTPCRRTVYSHIRCLPTRHSPLAIASLRREGGAQVLPSLSLSYMVLAYGSKWTFRLLCGHDSHEQTLIAFTIRAQALDVVDAGCAGCT